MELRSALNKRLYKSPACSLTPRTQHTPTGDSSRKHSVFQRVKKRYLKYDISSKYTVTPQIQNLGNF